jgi:3',5'-cyclic AMP phosphodiesterase CpdA
MLRIATLIVSTLATFGVGMISISSAHDGEHDHGPVAMVQPAEMYAPTAVPDRIILTLSGDPRTSVSVNWRTSTDVHHAIAEIAVAESGPYFSEKAIELSATTEPLKTDINEAHFHSTTFSDLQPGTQYVYRVGDGNNWSEWLQFKTAAASDEAFSFIYFGDAQNNLRSKWSRVIREAYREAPRAAFLLHAGDLVNRAESDGEWGEWFGAGGWLNGTTPNLAIPGNHEQAKMESGERRLSHHWRPTFTFPKNGPDSLPETCYTLVYHNMRIIGLDSNREQAAQAVWLEKVLAENTSPWVVCTFHHPIFSTGKDRDNAELRALWKPVFDKFQVDLVLQGHDHTYGRTGFDVPNIDTESDPVAATSGITNAEVNAPIGAKNVDTESGTIYVVSVSGPKMYNNNRKSFMKRLGEDTQLYQVITIDDNVLRFEAFTAIGELYDAFELTKQDGQLNALREIAPEVDENLRPLLDDK